MARSTEFYATTAQVVPVLFLALVVEVRVLDRRGAWRGRLDYAFGAISIVVLLALADFVALNELAKQANQRTGDPDILIWVGLIGGSCVLVAMTTSDAVAELVQLAGKKLRWSLLIGSLALLGLGFLTAYNVTSGAVLVSAVIGWTLGTYAALTLQIDIARWRQHRRVSHQSPRR